MFRHHSLLFSDSVKNLDIDELTKDAIVVVLESIAGGTFIYVTFFEVLAQERVINWEVEGFG